MKKAPKERGGIENIENPRKVERLIEPLRKDITERIKKCVIQKCGFTEKKWGMRHGIAILITKEREIKMGRKKFNRLTKKGKDAMWERIVDIKCRLTEIEDDYEKIYDLEEAINDNIKDLFECDQNCETCTELDRARCMQNFRRANVFYLQKLRTYESIFYDVIQFLVKEVQNLYNIAAEGKAVEREKDKEEQEEEDKGPPESMII